MSLEFSQDPVDAPYQGYGFHDSSERPFRDIHDVSDYDYDPDLGRDIQVNILVKWTNQSYHDDNLRAMFTGGWDPVAGIARTNSWRHRNQYYDGLVVQTNLGVDYIDNDNADRMEPALQPTGLDIRADGLAALACANKIALSADGDISNPSEIITHPTFARLHSVEFNSDGNRLLTASSSLDLLYEVDLNGQIVWTFDAWTDTPFNTNKIGQSFLRSYVSGSDILRNPDPINLKDDEKLRGVTCAIDDPVAYNGLGLPTNLTPVFMNTASYDSEGQILVTSFHRGEGWVINRNSRHVNVVVKGMRNPHGLHQLRDDGLMVTDTGNEHTIFIGDDLQRETVIDFSGLEQRKKGLEKSRWLQYTTQLDDNTYCAVIAPRQMLTLFDPVQRTRRDIPFDAEWGIQSVAQRREVVKRDIGSTAARS